MISLDGKCPVHFVYERGWNPSPHTSMEVVNAPEKDLMKIQYKNNELTIYPHITPRIIFVGDKKELAFGVALLISQTIHTLHCGLIGTSMIDEFFNFKKDGTIVGWKIVDNNEEVKEFVDKYNRVYPTVILLK
jgi:hypothetical protein